MSEPMSAEMPMTGEDIVYEASKDSEGLAVEVPLLIALIDDAIRQAEHAAAEKAREEDVLRTVQREQRSWVAHNFGNRPSYYPLLGAVEELGELAHSHLKQEQGIRMLEGHEENAKDAVADIIVFLCDYASARGWDIAEILKKTWNEVKQRDWKSDPETSHLRALKERHE